MICVLHWWLFCRTLGEGKKCLASLLRLLFSSLVSRNVTYFLNIETPDALTLCTIEWEYKLAVQICEQYASMTWLPSLVSFYEQRGNKNVDQSMFLELFLAMRFCLQKLQDPELLFKLESGVDSVVIQVLSWSQIMQQSFMPFNFLLCSIILGKVLMVVKSWFFF